MTDRRTEMQDQKITDLIRPLLLKQTVDKMSYNFVSVLKYFSPFTHVIFQSRVFSIPKWQQRYRQRFWE